MSVISLVADFFAGGLGGCLVILAARRRRSSVAQVEPTCSGYVVKATYFNGTRRDYTTQETKTDCSALRSPTCVDGRCSFHCGDMCKCDASNEPEFIGRGRS